METLFERQARKVLEFVIGGTRGGPMRMRILEEITARPRNTNEISKKLQVDYKTAEYHLRVLRENGLVTESGSKYDSKFSVSPFFKNWQKTHKDGGANKK